MTIDEHDRRRDAPEGATTTGQGYPEEQPPGAGIDAREHPEDDVVDERRRAGDEPASATAIPGRRPATRGRPGGGEDQ